MNKTFGVNSTAGGRPVAVVAPMRHRSPPASPANTDPNRPCNDRGADVVLLPTQESTVAFKDSTAACRGGASANTAQTSLGRYPTAAVNRNVPTLRTLPLMAELPRTSTGISLLLPSSQGVSSLGTLSLGTSLIRTSSLGLPSSEMILASSVLGLSCANKALTTDVADWGTSSCQCRKLDSRKTKDRRSDLSPTETTVTSVSVPSSHSGDLSPALFPETEDLSKAVDQCNFYYGNMTNTEAKSRLHGCPVGTFLLRDSSDARFRYSLSVKTPRGTTSIRIAGTPSGQYRLDSDPHQASRMPAFRWILSLVEHYFLSASPANSTAGEKGRHRSHCVLLESSGRFDTPMVLRKPLELSPALLAHLCRKTINNLVPSVEDRRKLIDSLATEVADQRRSSIQEYLLGYPFRV